mmetsp:Transcript_17752/g.50293  ORF Transcript_17752/g.50293 Transcript_17752/m.50293 type:complete len:202 (+) Transcript_17752:654-1259(+)
MIHVTSSSRNIMNTNNAVHDIFTDTEFINEYDDNNSKRKWNQDDIEVSSSSINNPNNDDLMMTALSPPTNATTNTSPPTPTNKPQYSFLRKIITKKHTTIKIVQISLVIYIMMMTFYAFPDRRIMDDSMQDNNTLNGIYHCNKWSSNPCNKYTSIYLYLHCKIVCLFYVSCIGHGLLQQTQSHDKLPRPHARLHVPARRFA